ncbi:E3 ubiquitin-protein ligase SHPRH-like [Gordionus sp. m RMFG-2023]|uniref:E3 ubiquitin-protein ligase SHPRH-like n=1 Tax=Gordionus sp. m RMFG-2023 TaxID=3053472 RepID=UPI0031FCCFCD
MNSKEYEKFLSMYIDKVTLLSKKPSNNENEDDKIGLEKYENCSYVSCICGVTKSKWSSKYSTFKCQECGILQHSKCLSYNTSNTLFPNPVLCCHCSVNYFTYESGATLIITPNSISGQWIKEFEKHVNDPTLQIMFYKGVQSGFTYPEILAKQDIIITTYEILMKELSHANLPHANSSCYTKFRSPKKFFPAPSPLTCIYWWRICLDEAQMIENKVSKTAKMVSQLKAWHKWCITGTPIQKDIEDLYGLITFLDIQPYSDRTIWEEGVIKRFWDGTPDGQDTFLKLFSRILWRTFKSDVMDQIGLPPQHEDVELLTFSPVEQHFYHRQYLECSGTTLKTLKDYYEKNVNTVNDIFEVRNDIITHDKLPENFMLGKLDHSIISKIMDPLIKLRQSCCHPQIVINKSNRQTRMKRIGKRSRRIGRKSDNTHSIVMEDDSYQYKKIMTMGNILESLIKKSRVECQEIHRSIISSLNGFSGIEMIKGNYDSAVTTYSKVFTSCRLYGDKLKTDALQRIHACVNLKEALNMLNSLNGPVNLDRDDFTDNDDKPKLDISNNLADEGKEGADKPDPLLDVKFLDSEYHRLREEYLQKFETEIKAKSSRLDNIHLSLNANQYFKFDYRKAFDTTNSGYDKFFHWFLEFMVDENNSSFNEEIAYKFKTEKLFQNRSYCLDLIYEDENQLSLKTYRYIMLHALQKLCSTRQHLLTRLLSLKDRYPNKCDINTATECHLRLPAEDIDSIETTGTKSKMSSFELSGGIKKRKKFKICEYCLLEENFSQYESQLFLSTSSFSGTTEIDNTSSSENEDDRQKKLSKGVWKESHLERALKIMAPYHAKLGGNEEGGRDKISSSHLKWFELVKREYKILHELLIALRHRIAALDELEIAITRFQLDETLLNDKTLFKDSKKPLNVVSPYELDVLMEELQASLGSGENALKKKLGHLYYLENLQKRNISKQSMQHIPLNNELLVNTEEKTTSTSKTSNNLESDHQMICPVCLKSLDFEWNVLICGHSLCIECVNSFTKQKHNLVSAKKLKCPICRECTLVNEIAWVNDSKANTDKSGSNEEIKGSYSTKITSIVAKLKQIQRVESAVKSLIFSSWKEILIILEHALDNNELKHTHLFTKKDFETNLARFKESNDTNILLIPFNHGAKGLNITEATHVFLMEPVLNQSIEAQAVNRVHRIGQNKITYVHKFIIKGTIEEKIINLANHIKDRFDYKGKEGFNLTLNQIYSLYKNDDCN